MWKGLGVLVSPKTWETGVGDLYQWVSNILVLDPFTLLKIIEEFRRRLFMWSIGIDIYHITNMETNTRNRGFKSIIFKK